MATKPKKTNKGGPPRKYALELPVYDSMEQCAAATGIPLAALKHAKKNGCIHVQHGRVHLGVFLKWFFARIEEEQGDGESNIDWAKRDKRASALIKEVKLDEERNRLIDFALVEQFVRYLETTCFFSELDRISAEFPSVLKGKSELEISSECERQKGIIKKTIAESVKGWVEKKGKV